jgi:hypothetical protein
MMETDWPALPELTKDDPQAEVKKFLYQAKLEVFKAERQAALANEKAKLDAGIENEKRESSANIEREKAVVANDYAQAQAVNSAYLDVAKSSIERATARASFVQNAATAVGGAYVGILGLSFAVSQGKYLPARGICPTIFLGLAIFFAAAYLSFVTAPKDVPVTPSRGDYPDNQRQRRNSFLLWVRASTLQRRWFLQASVISLGIGVLLLPLPYLELTDTAAVVLVVVGLLLNLLLPTVISSLIGERPANSLTITDATPKEGKEGETVLLEIAGTGFRTPNAVSLFRDHETIPAADITSSARLIRCKFRLDKEPGGDKWGLIVVNDDGGSARKDLIFTINR